jgi:tRNA-2-methylthio-N6-dimethylallyladenosine synthase
MAKRYHVTTFGCQMNVHDAERIRGMLEERGLGEASSQDDADLIVFNTCTIREKADSRFVQHLLQAKARKERHPGTTIAVGGCWSESVKDHLFEAYPFVDFAFGPGSIPRLGEWIAAGGETPRGHFSSFDDFAGDLPPARERPHQAWLQISMGCNSVCSYCIVPSVRGRERSRPFATIVAEAERLAADGVRDVTLLGQNVNSYGRDLPVDERRTFAELLRRLDAIAGLDRIRFTSPHPKDMREDVISAMAESESVCRQLHLPLQSGSTRILKRMRRTYSRERYLALVERLREAMPEIALTTDIIVGFPGETEADFAETMGVVDAVSYDHAFTFLYSPRSGTEAAAMTDQVPDGVKHERLTRLVELVQTHALRRNEALVGTRLGVLVEGPSRTDAAIWRGRSESGKTVLFPAERDVAAGDIVAVDVESVTSQTLRGALAGVPALLPT